MSPLQQFYSNATTWLEEGKLIALFVRPILEGDPAQATLAEVGSVLLRCGGC